MSIELIKGDIARQEDLEAVVNAANAELMPGGGVAGALHAAAGPELAAACRPLAPISPGEAVITRAFNLPYHYVIHALGPRYGLDEPPDRLLADAYRNALRLAREHSIKSMGFPALSAGAFGFPLGEAARIAIKTIEAHAAPDLRVRFVLFDDHTLEVFRQSME